MTEWTSDTLIYFAALRQMSLLSNCKNCYMIQRQTLCIHYTVVQKSRRPTCLADVMLALLASCIKLFYCIVVKWYCANVNLLEISVYYMEDQLSVKCWCMEN